MADIVVHIRGLHGDGDGGKTAVVGTMSTLIHGDQEKIVVIPQRWGQSQR